LVVVPNEGAWVGFNSHDRVWVEFTDPLDTDAEPGPVPPVVQVGRRVDFIGKLSSNPARYGAQRGFDAAGQASLDAAGFHLHVNPTAVAVHRPWVTRETPPHRVDAFVTPNAGNGEAAPALCSPATANRGDHPQRAEGREHG
jgi:hypothetical protein